MLGRLLVRNVLVRRVPLGVANSRFLHISRAIAENKKEKASEDIEKEKKAATEDTQWDRTIQEAIEQARRELEEASPKEQAQTPVDDYVTTLGRVMMELPHQLEGFFEHGLDDSIYTEQIKFTEPRHSGMQFTGRSQYMGMARVLRIAMNAWFSSPTLTILLLRQQQAPDGLDVCVRWVFEGMARHSEIIGGQASRYEGEFRYRIHPKSGLISVHEVTAIHPAPPTGIFATAGPLARWMGWLAPRGSLSLSK
ncbi:hypothetical protein GGH94_004951 [Coemansia aciculifera]|uniref:Uncharacterized protein n=1 Tax=Coemansia aciculifera TaxID=417176 RepID=A0A9W8M4C0_9FUNG|nr:hypothetical protein GGH94_004951 [Coemansia aciculifera]KAJ2872011.1 hypothetical protein GGH93_004367 [Coemansia aciculifera]